MRTCSGGRERSLWKSFWHPDSRNRTAKFLGSGPHHANGPSRRTNLVARSNQGLVSQGLQFGRAERPGEQVGTALPFEPIELGRSICAALRSRKRVKQIGCQQARAKRLFLKVPGKHSLVSALQLGQGELFRH